MGVKKNKKFSEFSNTEYKGILVKVLNELADKEMARLYPVDPTDSIAIAKIQAKVQNIREIILTIEDVTFDRYFDIEE